MPTCPHKGDERPLGQAHQQHRAGASLKRCRRAVLPDPTGRLSPPHGSRTLKTAAAFQYGVRSEDLRNHESQEEERLWQRKILQYVQGTSPPNPELGIQIRKLAIRQRTEFRRPSANYGLFEPPVSSSSARIDLAPCRRSTQRRGVNSRSKRTVNAPSSSASNSS